MLLLLGRHFIDHPLWFEAFASGGGGQRKLISTLTLRREERSQVSQTQPADVLLLPLDCRPIRSPIPVRCAHQYEFASRGRVLTCLPLYEPKPSTHASDISGVSALRLASSISVKRVCTCRSEVSQASHIHSYRGCEFETLLRDADGVRASSQLERTFLPFSPTGCCSRALVRADSFI